MLEILDKLRTRSRDVLWSKSRPHEDPERFIRDTSFVDDDSLIMSPRSLSCYCDWLSADIHPDAISERDQRLVDYFAGWSALNVTKYRIFTVVDTKHTNKTEKHSCHISFKEPALFVQQEKKRFSDNKT